MPRESTSKDNPERVKCLGVFVQCNPQGPDVPGLVHRRMRCGVEHVMSFVVILFSSAQYIILHSPPFPSSISRPPSCPFPSLCHHSLLDPLFPPPMSRGWTCLAQANIRLINHTDSANTISKSVLQCVCVCACMPACVSLHV